MSGFVGRWQSPMVLIRCPAVSAAAIVARPPARTARNRPRSTSDLGPEDGLISPVPPWFRLGEPRLMDAKQEWRGALGELQVPLSPAHFHTWLKDTERIQ